MADESGKRDDENKDAPEDGADKSGDGQSGIPEVEAELVSEQAAASGSGDAFDADAPKDASETDGAREAEPAPDPEKPARKSSLTPGVMLFLAFVVVALIAFAVWRFAPFGAASSNGAPVETSAAQAEDENAAPEEPSASDEDAARAVTPVEEEPADPKIANAPAGELKTSPVAVEEEETGALPPVSDDAAEKIQNMAAAEAKQAPEEAVAEEETEEEASAAPVDDLSTEEVAEANAPAPTEDEADLSEAGMESVEQTAENDAVSDEAAPQQNPMAQAAALETPPGDPANAQRLAALEGELARLRGEYADEKRNLENELAQARRNETDLAAEIERLRADLSDAEAVRDEAVNAEVASLRAEVERLRREQANVSARQMRASFALAALSRAVDQGDPFAEELDAVEEFAPGATGALAPYAESGVATEAALRIGFDAAAREALAAAGREKSGGGVAGLFARAQSLVSVRPAEPVAGDAPGAILSRAENALEEGDVAFALAQLEDLPPVAKEAMAAWISDAKARAKAQAALASLQTDISGETG